MNFCGENLKDFMNTLQENIFSFEEMVNIIRNAIDKIADELFLGKYRGNLNAPPSIYEPEGRNDWIELYCNPNGYEEMAYIDCFQTGENGIVTAFAYHVKGHKWTDEEIRSIKFLSQLTFMVLGRGRLIQLLNISSLIDTLTGITNTTGFLRGGNALLSQNRLHEYSAVFMNLKNFKYINKSVGSVNGDEVLKKYCNSISSFLDKDEIFARLGGDNFIALIKDYRINAFLEFISPVKVFIKIENNVLNFDIFAKMGVLSIEKNHTMSDVMNCTSIALNVAKANNQTNLVYFKPEMLAKVIHDKEISILFPKAMEKREFSVFYQPKINLINNELCGCEALVRWIKDGKIVPPMDFIPVLEREGTVCKLDFYVFETVCNDINKWIANNIEPVRVSVNFSKHHLKNPYFADDIITLVEKYKINPEYIEIELTEMSLYKDYNTLAEFVNRMKAKGIHTSIDDFGTGFSSLNLLKELNVDIIKLDKSFLDNISTPEITMQTDKVLIKNIVKMVKELNMNVIAEGVETINQAEFLKSVDCCMAQGFLFDRPLPHDEFFKRLSNDRIYNV